MTAEPSSRRTWATIVRNSIAPISAPFYGLDRDLPPISASRSMNPLSSQLENDVTVSSEEVDPTNTRIFIRFIGAAALEFQTLFSCLSSFGSIRSLCYNSKRNNVIVDFKQKAGALLAKAHLKQLIVPGIGVITLKTYWGKHIEGPLKTRWVPLNASQMLLRAMEVHALASARSAREIYSDSRMNQMLGLEPEFCVGHFGSKSTSCGCTWDDTISIGRYPLRTRDKWFMCGYQSEEFRKVSLGDLLEASYQSTLSNQRLSPDICITTIDETISSLPRSHSKLSSPTPSSGCLLKPPFSPHTSSSFSILGTSSTFF